MEIFKTTEGEFVVKKEDGVSVCFNPEGNIIEKIVGEVTSKLRTDSAMHKKIEEEINSIQEFNKNITIIDKIKGFDVFLDKTDYTVKIDINGEYIALDHEGITKLKSQINNVEKIKIKLASVTGNYKTGDRVLIYGPTGTGKTFDFIQNVEAMKKDGKLDDYDIITITEGFEDIDFLANIVPTTKGITYNEKNVVKLLKRAAAGEKVAILLDELNRGSKSFLNLVLKMLDAVDGKNYVISNFVKDEQIVVPIENVLFFATMNLGGKYVGTNALDEALFDRFNMVNYKGYDSKVEYQFFKEFKELSKEAKEVIKHVRELHKAGEIRAPISTRGIKMWAEAFINSGKTKEDFMGTFNIVLLNRLISVDDFGNPNDQEKALILKKFKDLGIIT